MRKTALERFERFVSPEPNSGCWLWTGNTAPGGYGMFSPANSRNYQAHRFSYEQFKGPIPKGLEIDHKCRVRCCVNPDHLEAVTRRINLMRSTNFVAVNGAKTHCKRGHELNAHNVRITKIGGRSCRICMAAHQAAYRVRTAMLAPSPSKVTEPV